MHLYNSYRFVFIIGFLLFGVGMYQESRHTVVCRAAQEASAQHP